MQQDTKRYLSYICPRCRQSVIVERDLFSLAASTAHIKCPCGKSELTVDFQPNRVHLTVPCLFCGREHQVSCSTHAFVRERALAFSCAASGLDCCYVGALILSVAAGVGLFLVMAFLRMPTTC